MIHVVGHTAIDHIMRVPVLPQPNHSTYVVNHQVLFGGGAANIAACIARLGGDVTLLSAVGGEFSGSDYDRWLDRLGVVKSFYVVEDKRTATAYIITDGAGDQVTYFEWGASSIFSEKEPPDGIDFVHIATADPTFNTKVAEKSRFCTFDPGQDIVRYTADDLRTILDNCDILFANRHEVMRICSILGISEGELADRVPVAVFTRDASGSVLHTEGREIYVPAVRVNAIDPTGAGDAYRAGFLTACMRGLDLVRCCRVGAVTASFVVEAVGTQTNLPDWSAMRERYKAAFPGDIPP
ncbi:MAG: carbohydrate kinase family protein [Methanoculleaceae archaeon]